MNAVPEAFTEIGVRLPLLIVGWGAVALFVLALIFVALEYRFDLDEIGFVGALFTGFLGALAAIVWLCLMAPFDGKYQHIYEVSGHVESVSNVLSESDDGLTRQPVVTIEGVDRPLVVDDPRAVALLNADVTLRCDIGWNYQAADSYSCRIVDFGGAR